MLSLQATRGDNYGNLKFPHKSEKEPLYGNMGIGEPDKPNEVYRLFVCVCVCYCCSIVVLHRLLRLLPYHRSHNNGILIVDLIPYCTFLLLWKLLYSVFRLFAKIIYDVAGKFMLAHARAVGAKF